MENQSPPHTGLTGLLEQLENVGTTKCDTCELHESLYEVKILHQPQGHQGGYKFR